MAHPQQSLSVPDLWIVSLWFSGPATLAVLAGVMVIAVVVGSVVAKRLALPKLTVTLALMSFAPIAALTIPPTPRSSFALPAPGAISGYLHHFIDIQLLIHDIRHIGDSTEKIANILLFVPIAFTVGFIARKRMMAALMLITMSALIEFWQTRTARAGDISDVLHNGIGAVLGILTAAALPRRRRTTAEKVRGPAGARR